MREEPIYILTMDPKVYKELLTHHRRGTNGSGDPSMTVSRLDLVVLDSAVAGSIFR